MLHNCPQLPFIWHTHIGKHKHISMRAHFHAQTDLRWAQQQHKTSCHHVFDHQYYKIMIKRWIKWSQKLTQALVCCADEQCDGALQACCRGSGVARKRAAVSHACDRHLCEHIWLEWFSLSQSGATAQPIKTHFPSWSCKRAFAHTPS